MRIGVGSGGDGEVCTEEWDVRLSDAVGRGEMRNNTTSGMEGPSKVDSICVLIGKNHRAVQTSQFSNTHRRLHLQCN